MTLPANKTKIVCTIGPASEAPEVLEQMIRAGMNVARLNFSHGTHQQYRELFEILRAVEAEIARPLAILQDLSGPKIRIGEFAKPPVILHPDYEFTIIADANIAGDETKVGCNYPELASELEDYFNQEQYEEALELCNVERNLLTDVIRAGLSRIDSGYERMQEAMQEAGEEAAVTLQQKISYLSLIGNISPMLGLLGTVRGMVGAFGQIAQMKVVRPQVLAGNINEALVTTLLGLIVAIPTMCFYQFFSNRVNKLVLESSTIVSDLMERFKPTK